MTLTDRSIEKASYKSWVYYTATYFHKYTQHNYPVRAQRTAEVQWCVCVCVCVCARACGIKLLIYLLLLLYRQPYMLNTSPSIKLSHSSHLFLGSQAKLEGSFNS